MNHHSRRPTDTGGTSPGNAHTTTEAWLRERFADLEVNDVAWLPDVSGVRARLARQRHRRRVAVGAIASMVIVAAALVVVLPDDSAQDVTASESTTTVPSDATWSSTSSNGFETQISRRPRPESDRLTEADLVNTNSIPVPGLPMRSGCSVAGILTVDITSPGGQRWSGHYAEYRNREMAYIDRAGAQVLDSAGQSSFATGDPFDVVIVTGLGDGDLVALSDTGTGADIGADDLGAVAANGVAVIVMDPAKVAQRSSLMPTVSTTGEATRPVAGQVDLYGGSPEGATQRDNWCSNRSIRPDGSPASADETAATTDAVHTTLAELPTGKFSGLDLEVGVPALGSTTADVEAVLADAADRAQASNYGAVLSQLVATVPIVQRVGDTLIAQVGLSIAGMTSSVIVDLHRQDGRWRLSPQSVCAALVLASTPCRPAP